MRAERESLPKHPQRAARPTLSGSTPSMAGSSGLASSVLRLQRTVGNAAVQRLLVQRSGASADVEEVAPEVEESIQRARGGGQPLEAGVRGRMEEAFGADFRRVRVHTGSRADSLNRALNARAFTTGRNIFFRQGEYNPGSSGGRELLAHELAHIMQQAGTPENCLPLQLGAPDDVFEQEAESVARAVLNATPEPRGADSGFRHEFSDMRIADAQSPDTAQALNARELTVGRDIVSGIEQYSRRTIVSGVQHAEGQRHLHPLTTKMIQRQRHATIGPLSAEQEQRYRELRRTFEIEVLEISALGPLLKINLRIRHPYNPWQNYHFFGGGPALGVEVPILSRPSNIETHTTRHGMGTDDFRGRGRVVILGVPHTNVRYMWLTFSEGPEEVGLADVTWRLSQGIRQPYAVGVYFGRFDFGHGLSA
jgi:hypothetical protein